MTKIFEGALSADSASNLIITGGAGTKFRLIKYQAESSNTVPVSRGGTGATSATDAKANLGIGTLGGLDSATTGNLRGLTSTSSGIISADGNGSMSIVSGGSSVNGDVFDVTRNHNFAFGGSALNQTIGSFTHTGTDLLINIHGSIQFTVDDGVGGGNNTGSVTVKIKWGTGGTEYTINSASFTNTSGTDATKSLSLDKNIKIPSAAAGTDTLLYSITCGSNGKMVNQPIDIEVMILTAN